MRNTRWIICYDFETDLPDPDECNVTELAAVPIDPDTLEIKKEHAFSAMIKPPGINKEEYFTDARNKTIKWHANNASCTSEEIVEGWKKGTAEKTAWKSFVAYCKKYEVEKRPGLWYPQPIPAGYNIIGFDAVILDRLVDKHKTKNPFSAVQKMDIMDLMFYWFESLDEPNDLKMDTLRKWLGMPSQGLAHTAIADVFEEAELLVRFLKFMRRQASVEKFKGSFAK